MAVMSLHKCNLNLNILIQFFIYQSQAWGLSKCHAKIMLLFYLIHCVA